MKARRMTMLVLRHARRRPPHGRRQRSAGRRPGRPPSRGHREGGGRRRPPGAPSTCTRRSSPTTAATARSPPRRSCGWVAATRSSARGRPERPTSSSSRTTRSSSRKSPPPASGWPPCHGKRRRPSPAPRSGASRSRASRPAEPGPCCPRTGRASPSSPKGGSGPSPCRERVHPDIAGEPTRLTPDMGAWDNGNMSFSWSYDGQWIAFRGRPDNTVYLVPSTGGEPKKIDGSGPSSQGVRPSVSPGGETVAFTRWHEKRSHIFAFPLAGGEPKLVTEEPGMDPAFSPDGKLIAYVPSSYSADRGISPPKTMQVKVVAVQGGATAVVHESEGRPSAPTWSPDGTMIAFGHWSKKGETEKSEICIVPVSSEGRPRGEPTRISLEALVSTTLRGEPARKYVNLLGGWSRRDEIALLLDTPFDEGIYTVPAAGGRATRVGLVGREPRWSPDGSRIYFRGDSMAAQIASVPARGGVEKPVPIQSEYPQAKVVVAFPVGSNDVSPDGKTHRLRRLLPGQQRSPGWLHDLHGSLGRRPGSGPDRSQGRERLESLLVAGRTVDRLPQTGFAGQRGGRGHLARAVRGRPVEATDERRRSGRLCEDRLVPGRQDDRVLRQGWHDPLDPRRRRDVPGADEGWPRSPSTSSGCPGVPMGPGSPTPTSSGCSSFRPQAESPRSSNPGSKARSFSSTGPPTGRRLRSRAPRVARRRSGS